MKFQLPEIVVSWVSRARVGPRLKRYWTVAGLLLVGAVVLVVIRRPRREVQLGADLAKVPAVAVARVDREDLYKEVSVPAEFRPYAEVTLHAKVSGYVDQMAVDFGDRVKAGQLLATLDAPDLVAQLNSTLAAERKANAAYTNAHLIYTRLLKVNNQITNLIAPQDLDTAEANERSTFAAVAAAQADRAKYETLVNYMKIVAPFDGVITRRYVDHGALIQAGTASETQTMPLVRVSNNYRLRLDFYISVGHVKAVNVGDPVEVRVDTLGGKTFTGAISRVTDRVEEDTRQMMAEIEVPNPKLEFVPGMYATVIFKVERRSHALALPTEAISTDKKSTVYLVNRQSEIEERPVTLGLETPTKYEVVAGLSKGDLVMIGARSEVRPGQKVEPKMIGSLARQ